jgi:hypothetical protein
MKFLEKLDFFKPLGKGLAEADTFMRREMPFNMSWGFPAALVAAYYGAPYLGNAMSGSGGGAGFTSNGMLSSLGLEGGGSIVPTAGNSFTLPSSAYTPAYLNKLAQYQGVDAGDPTLFQRLTGQTEQGLYDAQQPFDSKGLLGRLLRNQMQQKAEQPSGPKYTSNVAQGFEYEDLNEPFRNPNASQQERSRKLLAQQLRLLNAYQPPASSGGSGMRTMNIQNLFDRFGTLS